MAWIESHEELLIHPKTFDLMSLMQWDINTTIGTLHRFWWWCMHFAQDGDLRRHNASRLAAAVGVPNTQAEQFVDAMVQAEWLDRTPYFRVHDWWQYAGPFLQRKHSRNAQFWQKVRDSYITPCTTSTIELDESCCELENTQPVSCSSTLAAQQEGCSSPPTARPVPCSSTPAAQQEACSSPPTARPVPCSSTPPNLTIPDHTVPDLTKQEKQHQQHNSAAIATDPDEERPGRHQQKSTQTQPPVEGILADTVGPGSCTYTPPLPAIPGKDLEQIIRDRIGYSTSLSRLDLEKLIALKNKHGPSFYTACGYLHGRVTNAAAFLAAILEPRDPTEVFATKLKALMQAESVISAPQSGSGHG